MRHGENHVRLQALHRDSPQQPTPSVVKPEGRPAAERETGTGKLCDQVDLGLHIVGAEPSEASDEARVTKPVIGSHRGHQCSEKMLTGESQFHISPPRVFESIWEANRLVHLTTETW